MSLKALIEELGSDKTAAELVALLNAQTVEVVDPQLYTWAGVALIAGPDGAENFRIALEANGMGWAVHQLGGSGLQLSHPLTQQALTAFAAANVPGAALLKAAGIHYVSPYVNDGGEGLVTESQVNAALLQLQKEQLIETARNTFETYRVTVNEWNGVGNPPVMGG